jgi:integrase
LSKRLPKGYLKPLPRKEDVVRLLESCSGQGAKLAVGLAAFSGLRPGQVRELAFSNLVEFSMARKQFSRIPSQIELRNEVTWRKYYTFLSTSGCKHLLDDLSTRSQVSSKETVVTRRGLSEAGRVVRAAKVKWFELRHFFRGSCEWAELRLAKRPLPPEAIRFMLGNYVQEELDLSPFDSKIVEMLRQGYGMVEQECFM